MNYNSTQCIQKSFPKLSQFLMNFFFKLSPFLSKNIYEVSRQNSKYQNDTFRELFSNVVDFIAKTPQF